MKNRIKMTFSVMLLAGIAVLSTGCMTRPGALTHVGDRDDSVLFDGWTTNPNEYVYIYARDSTTSSWLYIGYAKTGTTAVNHFGTDWYYWNKNLVVPEICWTSGSGYWNAFSYVKATNGSGTNLLTFKEGFYDWFDDYDNLSELWDEQGWGDEVIIFANND